MGFGYIFAILQGRQLSLGVLSAFLPIKSTVKSYSIKRVYFAHKGANFRVEPVLQGSNTPTLMLLYYSPLNNESSFKGSYPSL